tara:strand:+ start:4023 stop:4277 length:255 start_codon:yes stop_codon:yes gene_type:complete
MKILDDYCERLIIESENRSVVWKSYTAMYHDILKGYGVSTRSNAWLVGNMIQQIDIRIPWAQNDEKLVLEYMVTGLRTIVKDLS